MILRSKTRLSQDKLRELQKDFVEQAKTGIIVLPDYIEIVESDKDLKASALYYDALTSMRGYSNGNSN